MVIKQSQRAFSHFAHLKVLFDKYDFQPNEENKNEVLNYLTTVNQGLPLPSGMWGSSLAVALEMHNYVSALLIITNATILNLDLERVSSELGGIKPLSAQECFDYSLSYFENELDTEFYKRYPKYLEYMKRKIAATEEIGKILNQKNK